MLHPDTRIALRYLQWNNSFPQSGMQGQMGQSGSNTHIRDNSQYQMQPGTIHLTTNDKSYDQNSQSRYGNSWYKDDFTNDRSDRRFNDWQRQPFGRHRSNSSGNKNDEYLSWRDPSQDRRRRHEQDRSETRSFCWRLNRFSPLVRTNCYFLVLY